METLKIRTNRTVETPQPWPYKFSLTDLKWYFLEHYSYISYELTDAELLEFIQALYEEVTIIKAADFLSDYLLSHGLCTVQE